MFSDLDWPINMSRGLSVIAEFPVKMKKWIYY